MAVETVDGVDGGVAGDAAVLAPGVLRRRSQERQVGLEDILDAEEDVPEAGGFHEWSERLAVLRDRRGHRLHDVVDPRQLSLDEGTTQGLEPRHVQRDVVVDEEHAPRAPASCVADVVDHAIDREAVEVAPAHFDDRAKAAVVRATARRLDDIGLPAEQCVAAQHPRAPCRWSDLACRQVGHRTGRVVDEPRAVVEREPAYSVIRAAGLEAAEQLAKGDLALAPHDEVDTRV